ncbi:uncharacterized protein RCO7_07394 [Rhynchosporium graminicola]|uniref:Velvet domain-containing protein n=1 Tax=Rhynchosporium graminicola TaxID=2792576 RepID=A0A1E1LFV2_9HELO|nr:uncharacterized protein RCO7_07394 [Rhynchosporium commune]
MASIPLRRSSNPMTVASTTRETPNGRTLRYDLTVIQQPERARACGSGAKSSADRRPVDPPPVVELRVFEKLVEKWEDITFAYGANFFLYATLEVARPMAHGRVQQQAAPQCPVLTGMPVSGMAYLDRPKEAGYFIFPDLSVRHEGMYILSFNLYEETRPDSEMDLKAPKPMSGNVMSPDASFDWRLEIKSEMFQVYSAKKFPGLAESTSISRIVAEQGCRVRIRRDVRMRRRDGKPNGDEAQAENYQSSRPVHDERQGRSRANTYGSEDGNRSAHSSPERPIAQKPENGHLGALLDRTAPQQFITPQYAPPQSQQAYAPPPAVYQQQGQQYSNYGYAQPPTIHPGYHGREFPASAVDNRSEREYETPEFRRASIGQPPYSYQHGPPPSTANSNFRAIPFQEPSSRMPAQLPPLVEKRESLIASSPLAPINVAPLLHGPTNERSDRPYHQYAGPQLAPAPLTPSLPEERMRNGRKRTHDSVFVSSSTSQPLYNGMRPGSSHGDKPVVDEEDEADENIDMVYKRANGVNYQRILPQLK